MRQYLLFLGVIALIPMSVSAISVSCSSVAEASSCTRCFRFDLGSSNSANNIFVPRSNIPTGQQEYVDLAKSSISGSSYQGASVSPTGTITNNFDRFTNGPTVTASWTWAKTKPGQGIVKGTIPASVDASKPVYSLRYTAVSHLKAQSAPNAIIASTEATQVSCDFFYVKAQSAVCGNGIKEGSEQCDIGSNNGKPGSACTSQCLNAVATAVCGNGIKEGNEQCDDGNTNNNDACSNTCLLPVCGNNIREGNEQCDIGQNNGKPGSACTSQCLNVGVTAVCGNGIREGNEQCDDGNTSNTDSCSTSCTTLGATSPACRVQALDSNGAVPLTTTLSCSGSQTGRTVIIITKNNTLIDTSETTSKTFTFNQAGRYTVRCYPDAETNQSNSCTTVINVNGQCGNGIVESDEQCDDGNTNNYDSCSNSCRFSGSTCGNGVLDAGEQCDDGNSNSNDTCTNICQSVTTPHTGPMGVLSVLITLAFMGALSVVYYRSKQQS